MGRQYPQFLFSNPQNTKSKGPFVVHCIYPRMIFKVLTQNNHFSLQVLDYWDAKTESKSEEVLVAEESILHQAIFWLNSQIKCGEIVL